MNVKLLRKIQKHILAEPKRYEQNEWLRQGLTGEDAPPCGTVGCIAGWACVLGGENESVANPALVAQQVLEIDEPQAERLFDSVTGSTFDQWPRKYVNAYMNAKTRRGKARAAVNRIAHFIKTKGAE